MKRSPKNASSKCLGFTCWLFVLFWSPFLWAEPQTTTESFSIASRHLGQKLTGLTDNIPQLLLNTVNEKIAGHISAKNFDYEAPSTVTLYGVQIAAPDKTSVIDVRELKIALSVKALFSGNLLFEEISIKEPNITLKSRNGQLNIQRAFKSKAKSSGSSDDSAPLSIHVETLHLKKGTFVFQNDSGMKLRIGSFSTEGKMDLTGDNLISTFADFNFTSGRFENDSIGINLNTSHIDKFELLGKLIRFEGLRAKTLGGDVSLSGRVNTKGDGKLKLSGSFQLPRNAWPEKIEPLNFDTPSVKGKLNIRGPFENPIIDVNTSFGAFEAYDYALASGKTNLRITTRDVHIQSLDATLQAGGSLSGEIHYGIKSKNVLLETQLSGVPAQALVPKTGLASKLKGKISGSLITEITLADNMEVKSTYNLATRNFHLSSIALPYSSRIKGSVVYKDKNVTLTNNRISAENFNLKLNGQVSLKKKTLRLTTSLKTKRVREILDTLPESLRLGEVQTEGKVSGTFDNYLYAGHVNVDEVSYDNITLTALSTPITVTPTEILVSELQAETSGGLCMLQLTLDLSEKERTGLTGSGQLHHIQLASLDFVQPDAEPLTGSISAEFDIDGFAKSPNIHFKVFGETIEYSDVHKGQLDVKGALIYPRLVVEKIHLEATGIQLSSEMIEAELLQEEIAGLIQVNGIDLEPFTTPEAIPLVGQLAGWLELSGHLKSPKIKSGLLFSNLTYEQRKLGDGKFRIDAFAPTQGITDYELSVSGLITSPKGTFSIQNYLHTGNKNLRAKIRLTDIDLEHYGSGWADSTPPMDGVLGGHIDIYGQISQPHIDVNLSIPQLGLLLEETPTTEDMDEDSQTINTLSPYKYLGPVEITGSFEDSIVDATVCAFPNFTEENRIRTHLCEHKERLQLRVQGNYHSDQQSILRIKTELDFAQLADYVPSLAQSEIKAGTHITTSLNLKRDNAQSEWLLEGSGKIHNIAFQSPQSPTFTLKQPFSIQFTNSSLRLNTPMELQTDSGKLTVSGFYTPEDLDLSVQGQVALAFASLFTDSITQSEGLLDLQVQAKGNAQEPFIEGIIKPVPGAYVHLASIDQDLIFHSGAIAFAQEKLSLEEKEEETIRVSFVDLKMKTDTGDLGINGDALLSPPGHPIFAEKPIHKWNLIMQASGLSYDSGETQIECAMHLVMQGLGTSPKLEGQIEVTEGHLQKEFQLNNFVMTAADDEPSAPLEETLYFIEDMVFNVAISVQSFEVETLLNSFALETDLQGRLQLEQSLKEPALTGSVELVDGLFVFPYAEFELASASVDFHQTPGLFIDPHFRLEAWSEITQRDVPQLQQETLPLVLILDGNLEQMHLNFRSEDGSDYSKTDLLALVLLGYLPSLPGQNGESGPSADNALRAVSRELTSSTRKQVEDVLRKKLGADVQVDLYADSSGVQTGVRWHLGKRLELEGAGGIQFGDSEEAQNNDLRLRFLIFDHLPIGKELFLEGGLASPPSTDQNAAPRGDIRLTFRILEQ